MVTSCGYLGALAGPAIIGGLAELTSLPAALGTVVALSGMIVLLAGAVRPRRRPPADGTAGPAGAAGPATATGPESEAGRAGAGTTGRAGHGVTDPEGS
jgi:hypothetical protein